MSKVFEVVPIDLDAMINEMCFNKYTREQFLTKETEIIKVIGCEIDSPHILEFLLLYFKLIRLYVQSKGSFTKETQVYITYCETVAKMYCRMTFLDIALMGVKPSLLAATSVCFGLFSG